MLEYQEIFRDFDEWDMKFVNVPHSAENTVFKDYGNEKKVDLLLVGSIFHRSMLGDHYPLRKRMASILQTMASKFNCAIHSHPGGELSRADEDVYAIEFAKAINSSKICITCSGAPNSRFGKYVEIPMCATAIAADMPGEQQEEFKKFLIDINMDMSDGEIIEKLSFYLENDMERKVLIKKGLAYAENYTQEKYAERFLNAIKN